QRARAVQQLEVGQRIMIMHEQIGALSYFDSADQMIDSAKRRALAGRRSNDFQRMEAGFLQQLKLANEAEPKDRVDEARVRSGADAPTAILVLVDESHPQSIILFPLDLGLRRPAIPVGTVATTLRCKVSPHGLPGVVAMPIGLPRAHQVAVRIIDRERWHEREAELEKLVEHLVPFFG